MFIEIIDLKTVKYQWILDQITENDDTILEIGISAGIEEVKSYLTPNNQHQWLDGRKMYDVETIFGKTGTDRNSLILQLVKTVSIWQIITLCNADIIYEQEKTRYEKAIDYLKMLASGKVTISTLETLDPTIDEPADKEPFRYGSRPKFNHE